MKGNRMIKTTGSGTVVVVNNVTLTNDLIFGWCVLSDKGWMPLKDWDVEELAMIRKATLGYQLCPTDFSDAVSEKIEEKRHAAIRDRFKKDFIELLHPKSKSESQRNQSIFSAASGSQVPFSPASDQDRSKDELELYKLIMKNLAPQKDETNIVDLGYCKIEIMKNGTILLEQTHRKFKSGEGKHVFESIENAVKYILRRYW